MKTKKIEGTLSVSQLAQNDDRQTYHSDLPSHNQCSTIHHDNQKTDELSAAEMLQMLEENIVPGVDHLNIFSFWMLFG